MATLDPPDASAFFTCLILLLQIAIQGMSSAPTKDAIPSDSGSSMSEMVNSEHDLLGNMNQFLSLILHDFRITHSAILCENELGYWVLP